VGSVVRQGHQMLTTLSSISSTFVFRYVRTAIRGIMAYMALKHYGELENLTR
jgi:hypothetical protein